MSAPRTLTLAWDPVDDSAVVGYRLHYQRSGERHQRSIDVGNETTAAIRLPINGKTYFLTVTSYDQYGFESVQSEPVAVVMAP
jgi:fibronectin type 3 domain-containing protein